MRSCLEHGRHSRRDVHCEQSEEKNNKYYLSNHRHITTGHTLIENQMHIIQMENTWKKKNREEKNDDNAKQFDQKTRFDQIHHFHIFVEHDHCIWRRG